MTAPPRPARASSRPPVRAEGSRQCSVPIWLLILSNLLVFQLTYFHKNLLSFEDVDVMSLETIARQQQVILNSTPSSYILDFPRGNAVALPSVRLSKKEENEQAIDRNHCKCR